MARFSLLALGQFAGRGVTTYRYVVESSARERSCNSHWFVGFRPGQELEYPCRKKGGLWYAGLACTLLPISIVSCGSAPAL